MPLSVAFSDVEFELVACSWHLHRVVVVGVDSGGSVCVVSGDYCYDRGGDGGSVFNGECKTKNEAKKVYHTVIIP